MEFFAQDSWKVTRRLTLDHGLRVSHFSPWYDRQGLDSLSGIHPYQRQRCSDRLYGFDMAQAKREHTAFGICEPFVVLGASIRSCV